MTSSDAGRLLDRLCFVDVDTSSSSRCSRCCQRRPHVVFVPAVTALQVAFFLHQAMMVGDAASLGEHDVRRQRRAKSQSVASLLLYRPDKQRQLWRFVLYMLVHAGWRHLLFNVAAQLVVGVPLELMHGTLRTAFIYVAGILAGSLATSVFDSDAILVGASGGVYALIAAHLPSVFLNYGEVELGLLKLVGVCVVACVDVGLTVSERYSVDVRHHLRESTSPVAGTTTVGYVAHLTGAAAGLAAGFLVLRPSTHADRDRRQLRRRRRRFDIIWSAVANVSVP